MTNANLPAPVLVTTASALKQLAAALSGEAIIAVDTESNSLHAYQEQVCLMQFSTSKGDYLVDPLALGDLTPLAPVFSDPQIEKVFHAAEYDLLCMRRDFSYTFDNLFDTMVAARILGREALGLGAMLEAEYGLQVDKRHQRANWGQRPLPSYLLAYAQLDTHFLITLRGRLRLALQERNLWDLAQEDFARLCAVNGFNGEERTNDCWRVNGAYDLTPQKAAVLHELCRYRDKVARRTNRPLFKVLNDSTLLSIAEACPRTLEGFEGIPGMTPGQIERHGKALLSAVQRGLQGAPIKPPRSPRPSEAFLERLEALRNWRKTTAQELGMKSDIVLPRDLLIRLAEQNPRDPQALQEILSEVPWRMEHFGGLILGVLRESKE